MSLPCIVRYGAAVAGHPLRFAAVLSMTQCACGVDVECKYHRDVAAKRRHHHSVYVVLLSKDVLFEPRFLRCNPDYDPAKPCVYVGMTGLDPDTRFHQH